MLISAVTLLPMGLTAPRIRKQAEPCNRTGGVISGRQKAAGIPGWASRLWPIPWSWSRMKNGYAAPSTNERLTKGRMTVIIF